MARKLAGMGRVDGDGAARVRRRDVRSTEVNALVDI